MWGFLSNLKRVVLQWADGTEVNSETLEMRVWSGVLSEGMAMVGDDGGIRRRRNRQGDITP